MAFGITAVVAGLATAGISIFNGIQQAEAAKTAAATQAQAIKDAADKQTAALTKAQTDTTTATTAAQTAFTTAATGAITAQQAGTDKAVAEYSPYAEAGKAALKEQQTLAGANGPEAQKAAIGAIQNSEQFAALAQQGEGAITANGSATGGLRGGNVQAALAQFRPQLLSQLIDQQYTRLGGLSSLGFGAAQGSAGLKADAGNFAGNTNFAAGSAGANAGLQGANANINLGIQSAGVDAQKLTDLGSVQSGVDQIPGVGATIANGLATGLGATSSVLGMRKVT